MHHEVFDIEFLGFDNDGRHLNAGAFETGLALGILRFQFAILEFKSPSGGVAMKPKVIYRRFRSKWMCARKC